MESEREIALFFLTAFPNFYWPVYYETLIRFLSLSPRKGFRWAFAGIPLFCAAALFVVLRFFSAAEVRADLRYQLAFLSSGMSWAVGAFPVSAMLGVSYREDVLEMRNPSAAWVVAGAIVGIVLCYGGANIGEGDDVLQTFGTALIGTALWIAAWSLIEVTTKVSELVTIERDRAAGLRLSSYLVASGLVLGAAAIGDWQSLSTTLRDFARAAGPCGGLVALSILGNRALRPTISRPRPSTFFAGALPGLALLALGILFALRVRR